MANKINERGQISGIATCGAGRLRGISMLLWQPLNKSIGRRLQMSHLDNVR